MRYAGVDSENLNTKKGLKLIQMQFWNLQQMLRENFKHTMQQGFLKWAILEILELVINSNKKVSG